MHHETTDNIGQHCSEYLKDKGKKIFAPGPTANDNKHDYGDAAKLQAAAQAGSPEPARNIFQSLSRIFIPLMPGFIACGLISGCLNVAVKLDPLLNGSPYFQLMAVTGATAFWGLNLFVGVSAAREFGGTPILGGILGALTSHPDLAGVVLNGYPLTPGRGGVIAVLLIVALGTWLEKRFRKLLPDTMSLFLTPLVTYLITAAFAVFFLQPLGGLISEYIGQAVNNAITDGGALTGALLGGTFLPLVMLGLHQALLPIHTELLTRYDITLLLPVLAMAGAGQVGASLAVFVRTRNKGLRKTVASALPIGLLGIGEPLIYGVTLPLGRPFIAACIGGACGGAVQALSMVGAKTIGISGLPLAAATNNITAYLAGLGVAYLGGFIATLLIGFEDPAESI